MSGAAVRKLVLVAREKFTADFGADPEMFDSSFWDVSCLKDRAFNRTNRNVYFTRHDTNDQPLPADFSRVVKSWLILDRRSPGNMGLRLATVRILWEAILTRRGGDPAAFRWQTLSEEDLSQAELLMRVHWAESTTYKRMMSLLVFTRFLASRNLCRPLYYTTQTPRVEDFNRHTIAGQQARRDRLPSEAVLNGLADIYREHAVEPRDKLRAAALAILVVTGFRIGELLTLPLDCEVREKRGGQIRYGIRYYREKIRGGARLFAVRWLTPIGAELAQEAISWIRKITHAAWQRAKVLELSPHRVPIPGFHWGARMTRREVARVLGCNDLSVFTIARDKLIRHRDSNGIYYRAFEVEAYLRNLRVKQLWTVDRRDGTRQKLSESLLIAFRNFFHATRSACPLLVEPVLLSQIADFVTCRGNMKSAFERFGIREPNGPFCRMTTHQLRHWLNHIADKGGLAVELQTRWLGRENARDTEAYRHATVSERLEWVKAGMREGSLHGTKTNIYLELPRGQREAFLEGEIQAVHFTAFGICLHDFAVTPCPFHLNCVRGCPDYLRTRGNQKQRQHLIQIRTATEQALAAARLQTARNAGIAEPWVRHCEETLNGIAKALAVDEDMESDDRPMFSSRSTRCPE
ncbi:MAG TPA: hypothetical protein VM912_11960 [Terriglobales bacterium]|nr:hypothetical protein [Terriglobales bacterium]